MAISATIITRDRNTLDEVNINLSYLNPELFPDTGEIPQSSYQALDQAARGICALSNNTYVDTLLNRSESMNEKLDG